ncbi:MAG: transposase [Thiogranum sp.]
MPRRARIAVAGIPWHIIQRGNNRAACFYSESDYGYYLTTLAEQAEKWQCDIHAYVMMTNHVHLLLTPRYQDSASNLMKHLGQRYVQYINRTYRRSGTLWEGRFRSCLAQEQRYVLVCHRYIELNPVRSGMVGTPGDYRWSSFRANALACPCDLLTPHEDYLALGQTTRKRCAAYRALFKAQLDEQTITSVRSATNGNYVLGSGRFRDEIAVMLRRRVEPGRPGRPRARGDGAS